MAEQGHDQEITAIRRRLTELSVERAALEARLKELLQPTNPVLSPPLVQDGVTTASSAAAKVALFRALFAGRADVFPIRWKNAKAERAGYAPACANE